MWHGQVVHGIRTWPWYHLTYRLLWSFGHWQPGRQETNWPEKTSIWEWDQSVWASASHHHQSPIHIWKHRTSHLQWHLHCGVMDQAMGRQTCHVQTKSIEPTRYEMMGWKWNYVQKWLTNALCTPEWLYGKQKRPTPAFAYHPSQLQW